MDTNQKLSKKETDISKIFDANVSKDNDCWEWIGSISKRGYPYAYVGNKQRTGWQIAFFVAHGTWSDPKRRLRSICGKLSCCRPEHIKYFDEGIANCAQCGKDFDVRTSRSKGRCHACNKMEHRKYYYANREQQLKSSRAYKLLKKYGLTEEEFDAIMSEQQNCCAICGNTLIAPHVDHCHTNGHVRGILCGPCNQALGLFRDNVENLQKAVEYLNERRGNDSADSRKISTNA